MLHDPKNHNTDIKIDTQIQFLILMFFCEKDNLERKDITFDEIMRYIPDNMDLWINFHDDQSDREALEKSFRKRVQDILSGLRNFDLETKGMDGKIIAFEKIQALERDPDVYEWKRGKDFDKFYISVLNELGMQFDIMIGTDEDEIDPYSDRCILTKQDQLTFLDLYRKSGLTP